MTNYQKRKEKNDEYRSKIMRFTFQLSLGDTEVREWFEQQPEKGAYLKDLILRDKAERLGDRLAGQSGTAWIRRAKGTKTTQGR